MENLIAFGGGAKALGNGKVGGYLVQFGDEKQTDLEGDFFTDKTDFDLERSTKTSAYYNHGLDPTLKGRKLGMGDMKVDEVGVWVEVQLDLRDDYEKAVYGMVKAGTLGWSSGTAPNLVERAKVGKSFRIDKWPLGLDASLTPTPAEPRNQAMTIKAWKEVCPITDIKSLTNPFDAIDNRLTSSALDTLTQTMWDVKWQCVYEGEEPLVDRIALWESACDAMKAKGAEILSRMPDTPADALKGILKHIEFRRAQLGKREQPTNIRDMEDALREVGLSSNDAKTLLAKGWKGLSQREVESKEEPPTQDDDRSWEDQLYNIELQLLEEYV